MIDKVIKVDRVKIKKFQNPIILYFAVEVDVELEVEVKVEAKFKY